MDVVSGIDETFAADWATWEKRARDFMNFRNAWVHAVSAQTANGEWMPVTAVRPVTDPKLVTAVDIIIRAASGRWVAIDGRDYITRALRVVRAEAYTTPSPSGFPPGVDPF